jgi:hypothetical protein
MQNAEVQLCAFDVLALDGDDLRHLPLLKRKANLERLLRGRRDGIFVNPFKVGAVGPDLFRAACNMGLGFGLEAIDLIEADGQRTGSRSRTGGIMRLIGLARLWAELLGA